MATRVSQTLLNFEKIRQGLPLLENLHHAQTIWYGLVFLKNLFSPVEAFTHLAYPFLRPYAVDCAKEFYEKSRGKVKLFEFGYDQFAHRLPAPLSDLSKEEIQKFPDESIGEWIKKQKENRQTLAEFFKEHPFARKVIESAGQALTPENEKQIEVKALFETFEQDSQIKTVLDVLENSSIRPAPLAKRLLQWKIELTDPESVEWLAVKVAVQALLILPLACSVQKTLEICVERSYSFSYFSLFFYALATSITTVLTECVAAFYLKKVASEQPPK